MNNSAGAKQSYTTDKLPSQMMNNNVLIRIDFNPMEDVVLDSGIILSGVGGVMWNESAHVARYGVVTKIPKVLKTRPQYHFNGCMEWKTTIEIEEGDTVYFTKIGSANAVELIVGGVLYYIMNYSDLVFTKRGNKMIPLNGYCLVEKVMKESVQSSIIKTLDAEQDKRLGVVVVNGTNTEYHYGSKLYDADVEVGDEVVFDGGFWTAIEYSLFKTIDRELGFVQKIFIVGVL